MPHPDGFIPRNNLHLIISRPNCDTLKFSFSPETSSKSYEPDFSLILWICVIITKKHNSLSLILWLVCVCVCVCMCVCVFEGEA
jgi:hypothetical protein